MKAPFTLKCLWALVSPYLIYPRKTGLILAVTLITMMPFCLPQRGWTAMLNYDLDVQINMKTKKITGKVLLKTDLDQRITFHTKHLKALEVNRQKALDEQDTLILNLEKGKQTTLYYEMYPADSSANVIEKNHLFLNSEWYPQPDSLAIYRFSVTLPDDFIATSETESTTIEQKDDRKTVQFDFPHPLEALHLAASTDYVFKKSRFGDIDVETYFFKEEEGLADTYIAYTKKYLKMYEEMLTPYPYKRFAVVENILPTGNSMPTFTLLGRQVVKLPFIVKTSLGHEILHQWFGNSVFIDFDHGNWAEGLTTYLADYHYADLRGEGKIYRKQVLVEYDSYVNSENAIPLNRFYTRQNRAQSAIGYGKSAMLFHGLKKRYGEDLFFKALRDFILQNDFRMASWHDIQRAFEKATGDSLYKDFGYWIEDKDIPEIDVNKADLWVDQGQLKLEFSLSQPHEAFPLRIPITLFSGKGESRRFIEMNQAKEAFSLTLDEPLTKAVIDKDYDMMRRLTPEETPPVLSSIMEKEGLILVCTPELRPLYQPLIDSLDIRNPEVKAPDDITFKRLKDHSFLVAGFESAFVDMLFGKQKTPEDGVHLKIHKNPYNPEERIGLLSVKNLSQVRAIHGKLRHYGKYSELGFVDGINTFKAIQETPDGISLFTREPTRVVDPNRVSTLESIIPRLQDSQIVYVGERHDRFAHHINQLQVIKGLHGAGIKIAVGMEMFRRPYQGALDDYMAGRIDEPAFLKRTKYFETWGYDYNLYKPIVDYLKDHGIPLLALNIERDVTQEVARGGISSLTKDQRRQLPGEMDLSNERYRRDLNRVFVSHGEHAGLNEFNYFLQAQLLWDEGMAETAQRFLSKNPDYSLVILAGNGHVRYTYGIPERLFRRNQKTYLVIVQDEDIEKGIADFVLETAELRGRESPRLGITIEEKDQGLVVMGVQKHSPAEKAGLKKGDVIKNLGGQPIRSTFDLKLALFYNSKESRPEIQIERDGKSLNKKIEF